MSAPPIEGSIAERADYVEGQKIKARARDEIRMRLAQTLETDLVIPRDAGYAVLPPGTLAHTDAVAAAGNGLIDSIGTDVLEAGRLKGGFVARNLLAREDVALDSPYMRFALDERVVGAIAAYLDMVPILFRIDVWYSAPSTGAPRSSQMWHLDAADTTQVKVWVHCSDVGPDAGPLTALPAAASQRFADDIGYGFDKKRHRVRDERVRESVDDSDLVVFEGPKGTVDFVDTSRCFHFGSRIAEGGTPRRMVFFQYVTPYSFKFTGDHRGQAAYHALASDAPGELERLVLGAA